MPSPLGHALAGTAIALAGDRLLRQKLPARPLLGRGKLLAACIALATLPDADLLVGSHRTVTHSVGATFMIFIVAAAVTGWVTTAGDRPGVRAPGGTRWPLWLLIAVLCAAAQASHIVLDWMGADRFAPPGIQALWPFSDRFYISGLDLFARIERRDPFSWPTMVSNTRAALQEIAIVGPVVAAAWWTARPGRRTSI